MAIEIPPLQADRLPLTEWPGSAQMARFEIPARSLLDALTGLPGPAAALAYLRELAAADAAAQVFVSPDRSVVQLLVEGRRMTLTAGARDAVLDLIGQAARGPDPTRTAPLRPSPLVADASTAARIASVDAQVQEARVHSAGAALVPAAEARPAAQDAPAIALLLGSAVPAEAARVEVSIAAERRRRELALGGDPAAVFVATLNMHFARLGEVKARIRAVDTTVAVQLECADPASLQGFLPLLAEALTARGLNVAHLTGTAPAEGPP